MTGCGAVAGGIEFFLNVRLLGAEVFDVRVFLGAMLVGELVVDLLVNQLQLRSKRSDLGIGPGG